MAEETIWGIHPGARGEAEDLFVRRKVIAVGWAQVGDLHRLREREDFKGAFVETFPDTKPGAISTGAGQLYRFVHEMQVGDLVVCPSKLAREVRIGRVVGDYEYMPDANAQYPNMRKVEWLKTVPRTSLSQGALYEMGSALTLFQIKSHADEIMAIMEAELIEIGDEDEEITAIALDIEQQTRDFVLKQLTRKLKGHPFCDFVAHLLERMKY